MSRRLLVALLAVTVLAVGAFFVPAALAIRDAQKRQDLLELQREASIVATRVAAQGLSEQVVLEPVNADHRLGLYGPDGRLLIGDGPAVATDPIVRLGISGALAEGYEGSSLIAAVPVRLLVDGSAVVVRIEAPRSESRRRYLHSLLGLAGAALAVIAVAGAVAIWLARRLNRPIRELRTWASSAATAEEPPRSTGIGEIDSLRDALVDGRTRVDQLLLRERSFSSQVSHQLRTPVAAMRVAIETELEAPRPDPTTVLRESVVQLDRLESTIISLLALSRDTKRSPVECEVIDFVRGRMVDWQAPAERASRSIVITGSPGRERIDTHAVGHILDVLVDNALRHGRGDITVRVACDEMLNIEVADAGTTPETTDAFAEAGSDSSHGIGLRLARSLAESCQGTLTLLPTPTTTFRLSLPR